MSKEDETYHQIEAYLKNKLSPEQKANFENEVLENAAFKNKVYAHKIANDLIIENRLENVKEILFRENLNAKKNKFFNKILFTTLLLSILLISSLWYISNKIFTGKKENKKIKEKSEILDNNNLNNLTFESNISQSKPLDNLIIAEVKHSKSSNIIKPEILLIDSNYAVNKIDLAKVIIPDKNELHIQVKEIVNTNATTIIKSNNETSKINDCNDVVFTYNLNTEAACHDKNNGSISISSIKGGQTPYTITLNTHDGNEILDKNEVGSGKYNLTIHDKNACTQIVKDIEIKEKICMSEYSFNPFMGELWEIPLNKLDGKLSIHDASGSIVHEQEIHGSTNNSWNGQTKEGTIKIGYFIFTIVYSNSNQLTGSVTIVQ